MVMELSPTYDNEKSFQKYSSGFTTLRELMGKFYISGENGESHINLDNYTGKYFYVERSILDKIRGQRSKRIFINDMRVFFDNTTDKIKSTSKNKDIKIRYRDLNSLYNEVINDKAHKYVLTYGYMVLFLINNNYIYFDEDAKKVRYSNTEIIDADQFVQIYPKMWKVIDDDFRAKCLVENAYRNKNTVQAGVVFDNHLIKVFRDIFKSHWGTVPNKSSELTKMVSTATDTYSRNMWNFFEKSCSVADFTTIVKIMENVFTGNGKSRGFSRVSCAKMLKAFNIPYEEMVGHIYVTPKLYDTLSADVINFLDDTDPIKPDFSKKDTVNTESTESNNNTTKTTDTKEPKKVDTVSTKATTSYISNKPILDAFGKEINEAEVIVSRYASRDKVYELEARVKALEDSVKPKDKGNNNNTIPTITNDKDIVTLFNSNADMITLSDMDKNDYVSLYKTVSNEFIDSKVSNNKEDMDTDVLYKFLVCIMNADIVKGN